MFLVPRNVVTRFQFFPGFGIRELGFSLAGVAVGGVCYLVAGLANAAAYIRIPVGVLPVAAAYAMTRPGADGMSMLDLIRRWRAYRRGQQTYISICVRGQDG